MKKILAFAMTLVMMMAVMVPAFAAANPIKETGDQFGTADVKTDASALGAGTYTVSYPAEIVIPWNQTKSETYTVKTQLAVGKTLNVSVSQNGTMTATGTTDALDFNVSGDVSVDYVGVADETETLTFAVQDWNKTIAEYTGTVTFTATLGDVA